MLLQVFWGGQVVRRPGDGKQKEQLPVKIIQEATERLGFGTSEFLRCEK